MAAWQCAGTTGTSSSLYDMAGAMRCCILVNYVLLAIAVAMHRVLPTGSKLTSVVTHFLLCRHTIAARAVYVIACFRMHSVELIGLPGFLSANGVKQCAVA
jgi:hypothetical protein